MPKSTPLVVIMTDWAGGRGAGGSSVVVQRVRGKSTTVSSSPPESLGTGLAVTGEQSCGTSGGALSVNCKLPVMRNQGFIY